MNPTGFKLEVSYDDDAGLWCATALLDGESVSIDVRKPKYEAVMDMIACLIEQVRFMSAGTKA